MSALAFYKRLRDAGVDEATAMLCAEQFDAEVKVAVDAILEPRRAKDRARKAAKAPQNSEDSTATPESEESAETPVPETKVSPTPLSKTQTLTPSKNPPKGGQKGSRLPENWRPDEGGRAYAGEVLGPNVDPDRELDRFRDYWRAVPGAKGLKLDWSATWRNWCRNAADRLPTQRKAHERSHPDAKFDARQANLARHDAGADLAARLHRQS